MNKKDVITVNKLKKLGFYEPSEQDKEHWNLKSDESYQRRCLLYNLNKNKTDAIIIFTFKPLGETIDDDCTQEYSHLYLNGFDDYHCWTRVEMYEPHQMTEIKSLIDLWNNISTKTNKKVI